MSRGINKVILIGNVGNDPDVRFRADGAPIANLSIATSEKWLDKQSGQQREKTEWHRVVIFGKTAEIAQQYLKKGSKVYIEGKLQTRKWQANDGTDRYTTEVIIDGFNGQMQMLDRPDDRSDNSRAQNGYHTSQQQPAHYQQQPNQYQQARNGQQPAHQPQGQFDQYDQNIPF